MKNEWEYVRHKFILYNKKNEIKINFCSFFLHLSFFCCTFVG